MALIALTGGIGTGKGLVTRFFSELGVPIIDTDTIARNALTKHGVAYHAVIEAFGDSILAETQDIDRMKLRDIVFNDPKALLQLEGIVHPIVRQTIAAQISAAHTQGYAILVVPLLFEKKTPFSFNRVVLVDCPESLQIERVCKRDNCSKEQAIAIMQTQISREERRRQADDIIENDGSEDSVKIRVRQLHELYSKL